MKIDDIESVAMKMAMGLVGNPNYNLGDAIRLADMAVVHAKALLRRLEDEVQVVESVPANPVAEVEAENPIEAGEVVGAEVKGDKADEAAGVVDAQH